jgi:hypothetical protein
MHKMAQSVRFKWPVSAAETLGRVVDLFWKSPNNLQRGQAEKIKRAVRNKLPGRRAKCVSTFEAVHLSLFSFDFNVIS